MPQLLGRVYSYSVFMSVSSIVQCPVNMNIAAPKKVASDRLQKPKNFSKLSVTVLIKFC
jgi:hypothetical protein